MSTGAKVGMWIGIIGGLLGLTVGIVAAINPMLLASWFMPIFEAKGFDVFMTKYMGLVITAIVLLPMLFVFTPILFTIFKGDQKRKKLMAIGAKTMAKIISVQDTGITVNNAPYAKYTVEVKSGVQAQFSMMVNRLSIPRPGDSIEVYYDPSNPSDAVPV